MAYTKPSLASNANINQDFSGKREVIGNQELVQFHKKSFVRTWFNDLALDYESHWHSAIEIILPLENYYEISVQDETYHINPGEIIMIPPGEIHSIQQNGKEDLIIQVDGGINDVTSKICISLGATSLVAGSSIYKSKDIKKAIESLRV